MKKKEIKQNIIDNLEILDLKEQLDIAIQILDNVNTCLYVDGNIQESNEIYNIMEQLQKFYNKNKGE